MKLLKDITGSLARPPRPNNNRDDNDNDDNDDNDNDDNDNDDGNDDNGNNDIDNNGNNLNKRINTNLNNIQNGSVFLNNLNTNLNNIQSDSEHYARLIAYQNVTIGKVKEELTDKKNLTQYIRDQAKETIEENNKERLKYCNKYKNTLVD